MRRLLLIAIPIAAVLALAGLSGQHAEGSAMPRQLGPAAHVLPRLTVAHAATPHRAPLRFTLVDVAGAAVHRWPGGPISGTIAATTPLASHSWAWALATTRNHRWAHVVLSLPAKVADKVHGLFPGLPSDVLGLANRWLLCLIIPSKSGF